MRKFGNMINILLMSLIPTLFIWLPYFLRSRSVWGIPLPLDGMATVVANYDGPLFIVVAKSLYNPEIIQNFAFNLPSIYYAAHFPLYPIFIKLFAIIFGFPYSMLFVTLVSSVAALYFFNKLAREFLNINDSNWLTFVFSILPARWLIVRSVGSSEPLFIALIIASIYYFRNNRYLLASLLGAAAALTKPPGILLFFAFGLATIMPTIKTAALTTFSKWFVRLDFLKLLSITLIPLSLVGLFYFYKIQFGNFFAYFHSGDNIHIFFPPFQVFNFTQPWVGTFWLEEIIFAYILGGLGLIKLIRMKEGVISWFSGIFFISLLFVAHRDIIRYALPIVPFILIAFKDTLIKKEFKYVLALVAIPIYLYSIVYISQNVMPISDWTPLL
jgi:Gpi18-like mannosyltransferase